MFWRDVAVADVAVVPTADPMAGEYPRAFLVAKVGKKADHATAMDIFKFVDEKVAPHKRLRGGICWIEEIPKNPSGRNNDTLCRKPLKAELTELLDFIIGKILRRVLRDDPAKGLIPHPAGPSQSTTARL